MGETKSDESKTNKRDFYQLVDDLKQRLKDARPQAVDVSKRKGQSQEALYRKDELFRPADQFRDNPEARDAYSLDTANDYAKIIHSPVFRLLQGKTQLFPVGESELLRTRLTHSLEVAEVASRLAAKINQDTNEQDLKVDISIVAAASLAHDLGHPPFGHAGEKILNKKMKGSGGFEGNAQTLRIITRLENRISKHHDSGVTPITLEENPKGLNLLYRTIAATIKRDEMIPLTYEDDELKKGYYEDDKDIVLETKKRVLRGNDKTLTLNTIECQIMDIADDIAYSTYDLEDCMIAGVATPLDLMACSNSLIEKISNEVTKRLQKGGYQIEISKKDIQTVFMKLFEFIALLDHDPQYDFDRDFDRATYLGKTYRESNILATTPVYRRRFSELLIDDAIESVSVRWNADNPELSQIVIGDWQKLVIECLKSYNYLVVITSQRLQLRVRKCEKIISTIFDELNTENGIDLVDDSKKIHFQSIINKGDKAARTRFICDYIAAMTDKKAIELYAKIRSTSHVSVFGLEI